MCTVARTDKPTGLDARLFLCTSSGMGIDSSVQVRKAEYAKRENDNVLEARAYSFEVAKEHDTKQGAEKVRFSCECVHCW